MKTNVNDFDEIVFEKRNREYGAYALRKSYGRSASLAIFVSVFLFLSGVSLPLIAGWFGNKSVIDDEYHVDVMYDNTLDKPREHEIPEAPRQKLPEQMAYKTPVVVVDTSELTDLASLIENTFDRPLDTSSFNTGGDDDEMDNQRIIEKDPEPEPLGVVEEMPQFPGGEEARRVFLSKNTVYPLAARQAGIQGTVHVNFIVETDGAVTGVKLLRGIGGGCDEEALRVVTAMPKWIPGRQNGRAVRVSFNMPINFVLK